MSVQSNLSRNAQIIGDKAYYGYTIHVVTPKDLESKIILFVLPSKVGHFYAFEQQLG